MSKILRRPMFRGGGKVSSYGKGIAAPLVPGYQKGGQIGGGIIYGKPMSDGRYGFAKPVIGDFTMPSSGSITTGQKILSDALLKTQGNVPMIPINTGIKKPILKEDNKIDDIIDISKETEINSVDGSTLDSDFDTTETITLEDGSTIQAIKPQEGIKDTTKEFLKGLLEPGVSEGYKDAKRREEIGGRDLDYQDKLMQENYDKAQEEKNKIPELNLGDDGDNSAEDLQISAKDAIRQNQELFKDLLGDKKARGQDISDMLLRFSGSQGDTLGEKFQNYTRAEAAAGPGRSEKISQTAAGLAINDFVAGKRSKEQIEALKGKIDYEYGKKAEMVNVQPGDDARTALFKIAKKGDVKPNSDAAYKYLIEMKTGSDKTFRIDKVKMKDLEKPKAQKKLKIGFNIIEEDGRKNIVQWDGTNYNILSISELWEG
jgi:hypothetical protein